VVEQFYKFNLLTVFLLPLSALYWLLQNIHQLVYRTGLISTVRVGTPVVVVGNLTVGGTGKTPLVAWLARLLQDRGFRPGIVLRGYKGQGNDVALKVTGQTDPALAGDESVLLARQTGLPVYVCKDRVAAAKALLSETTSNIVISDDGLQHYRLGRDIEIVVVDGERRFGNTLLLPAGPLRESTARLKRVDFILCRGGQPEANEIEYRLKLSGFRNLRSGEFVAVDRFTDKTVNCVAAIGNPNQFFNAIAAEGFAINPRAFPDHHYFVATDLEFGNDLPVIMTEKDAVKCADLAGDHHWFATADVILPERFANSLLTKLEQVSKYGQKTA
jgi:tetraacyldisaccharide 4'-kinase